MYEGDFVNGKYEGHGKFYFDTGIYYIGEWKNNIMHGKGKLYDKEGQIMEEGIWNNGEYQFND